MTKAKVNTVKVDQVATGKVDLTKINFAMAKRSEVSGRERFDKLFFDVFQDDYKHIMGSDSKRQEVVRRAMAELKMSKSHAETYYYNATRTARGLAPHRPKKKSEVIASVVTA